MPRSQDVPLCEACRTGVGVGYENMAILYREHNICGHCIARWKNMEKRVGREVTWEEMLAGKPDKNNEKLTVDDLTRLDNYGHRELEQITEIELNEYATLLKMRRQEVLKRILELRK